MVKKKNHWLKSIGIFKIQYVRLNSFRFTFSLARLHRKNLAGGLHTQLHHFIGKNNTSAIVVLSSSILPIMHSRCCVYSARISDIEIAERYSRSPRLEVKKQCCNDPNPFRLDGAPFRALSYLLSPFISSVLCLLPLLYLSRRFPSRHPLVKILLHASTSGPAQRGTMQPRDALWIRLDDADNTTMADARWYLSWTDCISRNDSWTMSRGYSAPMHHTFDRSILLEMWERQDAISLWK